MPDIIVKQLAESDLSTADSIFRLAFGAFLKVPDPDKFGGDSDYIRQRWAANPEGAFGAYVDGELAGSNFASNTGSVGHFGPLTTHPDYWDKGVGQHLLSPALELLESRGVTLIELMTFTESPKHLAFYQKFGFWPRFLTPVMSILTEHKKPELNVILYSQIPDGKREKYLGQCRIITDSIYQGMDLEFEIRATHSQELGDTLMIEDGSGIVGFAICRCGAGTEAGSGSCMAKFGAIHPGKKAEAYFDRLLNACMTYAANRSATRFFTGVNTARHEAYRKMLEHGFRIESVAISMSKPNVDAYNRPDVFLIDDWR